MQDQRNDRPKVTVENAKSLALRLGVSKRQVFRLKSKGELPAPLKIGGSIRWISDEISSWILAGAPDRKSWEQMRGGVK